MKTFMLPDRGGQVKAGAHYFIISLYVNNILRSDIDINWVINAYPCIYFCISIMKSFFSFSFFLKKKNIQGKYIHKFNDLQLS